MTTFSYSTDAPATVKAGVLVLPMFLGPKGPLPGPGVKEVGLEQAYRDAKLTGKKQENLLVVRRDGDRFAAGAVLLVGVGGQGGAHAERHSGVCSGARRSAGPVSAPWRRRSRRPSPARAPRTRCRRRSKALVLGTYRFDRYKTAKARDEGAHADHGARDRRGPTRRRRATPSSAGQVVARGRLLGARPGEHARRRHAAGADRARGAEDGPRGRPALQGLGRSRSWRRAGSAASSASAPEA